ncbi:signal recognition particle protein [Oxobacter pfennigii]|uniref:Signal recognition particle protein n=1 Tax=Oxobacter pfennigii TaxID=36849 RepID=A0A0P8WZL2_9CLOT|nr:signal recognition particle protein [Oxobacter pfennigii]KPU43935.1 signal recognition particle protein [Oxobacter pfennigii]
MAFESLTTKLQETFKKLRGKGRLNEKDVKEAMREVRLALLEADVNYKVVKELVSKVSERAVGAEVMESLTPGQHVIKIVNEELVSLMGSGQSSIVFSKTPPTKIMLVGLQGAGKTTMAGKLGQLLKKQGKRPLLAACDIYRPAAIKQLQVVAEKLELPVFSMGDKNSPVDIAKASISYAESNNNDVVIIDTAGRLHVDEELMQELVDVKEAIKPDEILLVVDSMTGQDAVNVAETFNSKLDITGVILTKLDGDTRGGAALSVRYVTGKPIKFAGIGEKLTDIEVFYPDRMASRVLGMGDVLSLIEKAQDAIDEKKALELSKKMMKQEFTFDDFLDQMQQMKKMGSIGDILSMIPGVDSAKMKDVEVDEKEMAHVEAIIKSMTKDERRSPQLLKSGSRRKRIASGSGTKIQDVNKVIKQFEQGQKMMKQFSGMMKNPKKGKFKFPF